MVIYFLPATVTQQDDLATIENSLHTPVLEHELLLYNKKRDSPISCSEDVHSVFVLMK